MKHTPGPWVLDSEPIKYHWQIYTEKWKRIASSPTGGGKNTQCQINEFSANARLISAAPDLLEALQYAITQVPELATVPGISAAISKATGQTQ